MLQPSVVERAVQTIRESLPPGCRGLWAVVNNAGTILYWAVLYSTLLYCTVLHCTVLYCTDLHSCDGPAVGCPDPV